jgi:uncharacterized metal-binding protein
MKIAEDALQEAEDLYKNNEEVKEATRVASIVEAKGYIKWPRLKDTIEYAKGRGYKKLGLAFCVGMLKEARKVAKILEKYKFDVCSICCKTGSIKKEDVGVPKQYNIKSKTGYTIGWITCNPAGQAKVLNAFETDMNLIVGLCVGHDITFTQLSNAPVTTLIAKDRSTIHNPAAILFSHYGESFFAEDLRGKK